MSGIIFQPFHTEPEPDSEVITIDDEPGVTTKSQDNYSVWKKNAPLLYSSLQTSTLAWPSLCLEWFPDVEKHKNYDVQRLLLGSYSSGFNTFESLEICNVQIPHVSLSLDQSEYDSARQEFVSSQNPPANQSTDPACKGALGLVQSIPHKGDINKVSIMPQNPDVLAAISSTGAVSIFDKTKKASSFDPDTTSDVADITLQFHSAEGWGLDWNKYKEGQLVSGANDGSVALWDVKAGYSKSRTTVVPSCTRFCHDFGVNSVKYAWFHDSLVGSAGEDGKFRLLDTRKGLEPVAECSFSHPLNTLDFNKQTPHGLVLGDDSGNLLVQDLRRLDAPQTSIKAHEKGISASCWNYNYANVLASASADGLVKLWRVDSEPKLLFTHGGHMLGVSAVAWNPNDAKMLASAADDNSVHIWKPADEIF